jgi:hypothetical protein
VDLAGMARAAIPGHGGALKTSRLAIAGVAVFAVVGLVAACDPKHGNAGGSPTVKASSAPAPQAAVAASIEPLGTSSYRFTITSAAFTGEGSRDVPDRVAKVSGIGMADGVSMKIDFMRVGDDAYAKLDFGALNSQLGIQSDKYLHLDLSRLSGAADLPLNLTGAPIDLNGLLIGLNNDVKTIDGKTYTGTVDLTKATGGIAPDADVLGNVGDKAKSVPFTAKRDDQGRLTYLKIDGGLIDPHLAFEVAVTGYGTATNITEPDASQVLEAPDSVLKIFGDQ